MTIHRTQIAEKLPGFRVLCLANEVCLSDEQIDAVKAFVRAGGGLIATHETSLFDDKARPRGDFGLAELFGASYLQTRMPPNTRRSPSSVPPITILFAFIVMVWALF